ncbi:hypothetical protein LIER_00588 [Lithospermum erythrorhizon]|uniref:Reverse transcriptase domain-containing protein n=1 Tax=Lithospermum erythrorhizon TaxID=34254 RepID=A0AAV3NI24_LITER
MKIYVDDILVKSKRRGDHLCNLEESLEKLRRCKLRINPEKCSFRVSSAKFLGFMIIERGIESNPDKIEAFFNMKPPSIRTIKTILGSPKLLTRPKGSKKLQLYLAVSKGAISSVFLREEQGTHKPIYYVSHVLHGPEKNYPLKDKFVLSVPIIARKLKAYFEAHVVNVMTDQQIKRIMTNPAQSGRLITWDIELSEFKINYALRAGIKAQILPDFIVESTARPPCKIPGQEEAPDEVPQCILYVDGASNDKEVGAGVLIQGANGEQFEYPLHFSFKATNNEAEYEAVVKGS